MKFILNAQSGRTALTAFEDHDGNSEIPYSKRPASLILNGQAIKQKQDTDLMPAKFPIGRQPFN